MSRHRPARRVRGPALPVVLLALLVVACGGPGADADLGAAVGGWRFVEGTVPSGALAPVPTGAEVTLVLEADPGATDDGVLAGGSSGCNQYGTRIVPTGDGAVGVADIASTLMACADADANALEAGYLEGLALVSTLEVEGERLVLSGPGVELRFARTAEAG